MSVFSCKMCGHCCSGEGGIVMSEGDQQRLRGHLGLGETEFLERCADEVDGKLYLKAGPDGYCMYFSHQHGCGVHPARPDICRAWPFFRGNLLDELSFAMARQDCPGISLQATHGQFVAEGLAVLRAEGLMQQNPAGRAMEYGCFTTETD